MSDIATDPLWADYKGLALKHGLRSCWSEPVRDSRGKVLGTFAMYHRHVCTPAEEDLQNIRVAAHLAGIAMERARIERFSHPQSDAFWPGTTRLPRYTPAANSFKPIFPDTSSSRSPSPARPICERCGRRSLNFDSAIGASPFGNSVASLATASRLPRRRFYLRKIAARSA